MNIEELREHCLTIKGASEGFPFVKFSKGARNILVFKVMDKMFAHINLFPSDGIFCVWLKCSPERSEELRKEYEGVVASTRNPARSHIGVILDSDLPDSLIKDLIHHSVEEVIKGLSKKKQEEYKKR